MSYDFDTVVNRCNTDSLKWRAAGENELPMWVADMDFPTAPEVRAAMQRVLDHGVFGYTDLTDEWYDSIINWWKERHDFTIERDWLVFSAGVIPALSSSVRRFTAPAENVLVQTPVYNMFFNCIRNNGRNIVENRLHYDKETASYSVDWEDLERKLANPQTSMMILCNPQNPVGKIWEKETLAHIGELCAAHRVLVVCDEIHCDLTEPGCGYVPFASASETCRMNSITCISPTKAFNLAGLQTAAVVVPEPALRHRIWRALNNDEVGEANAFAAAVSIAAFTEGGAWLDELNAYIAANRKRVADFLAAELPQIRLVPAESTYLLWLDCTDLAKGRETTGAFIRRETGLILSDGSIYGESGMGFLRMNVACPRATLEDGLERLKAGIEAYEKTPQNL